MSRKILTCFLLTLLYVAIYPVAASEDVESGANCRKVGITSVTSDKVFTCIESGKKLIWDKGKPRILEIVRTSQSALGEREFGGIAISDDGSRLLVSEPCSERNTEGSCVTFGYLYTSSDFGLTWLKQENAGMGFWKGVASSSDGKILHAVSYIEGKIYRSEDYGLTWNKINCCHGAWWTISTSADGQKIIAAEYVFPQGRISTSQDGGNNWIDRLSAGNRSWVKVTSSDDGSKLAAIDVGGYIYTSDDSGASWRPNNSAGQKTWWSVDMSSDGKVIAAVAEDSNIMISNNFGNTWNSVSSLGMKNWGSITVSGNGKRIFALGDYGVGLYYSIDSGKSWSKWNNSIVPGNWELVSSKDGSKVGSIPYKGQLNTFSIQ